MVPSPRSYQLPSAFLPVYAGLALTAGILAGEKTIRWEWFTCQGNRMSPHPGWLGLAMLVGIMMLVWGRRRRGVLILAVVWMFFFLGTWRYLSHPMQPCFGPDALVHYHADDAFARPRVMEGVIVRYPILRQGSARYVVQIDTIWEGHAQKPVQGLALVTSDDTSFTYGDRVQVRGVPRWPPTYDDFNYRRYLARQGIHTLIRHGQLHLLAHNQASPWPTAIYAVRTWASRQLNTLMPQPYAALANGMILGIESGIPDALYDDFNRTGTSHVIVISGSNIALVSGLLWLILSQIWRHRRGVVVLLTLVGIVVYVVLVGADPAVTRAGIMGGLLVVGMALGRQSMAIVSLFLAGIAMLLGNPLILWDVGFELSFMATLGLILLSGPWLQAWHQHTQTWMPSLARRWLGEGLIVTLAAQTTTLPLLVIYFGRLSLLSLAANILILPVQPLILIAGGAAIPLAEVFFPLGQLMVLPALGSLMWTVWVVESMASVPWATVTVGPSLRPWAWAYLGLVLIGLIWWLWRQEQGETTWFPPTLRPWLTRAPLAALVIIIPAWFTANTLAARPDGQLHLYLVGWKGQLAWYVRTPHGHRWLWLPPTNIEGLSQLLARLPGGRAPLDAIILADNHPPHDIPARYLLSAHTPLPVGTRLRMDDHVEVRVEDTPEGEPRLFRLTYGHFAVYLPLTNSQKTQARWLAQGQLTPITCLVTPWPQTHAWPHPDLIQALQPRIIILPTGARYPPTVQQTLAAHPAPITVPDQGILEIATRGDNQITLWRWSISSNQP